MEIMTNLEQEWAFAEGGERLHLALEGCFYIIGYTLALQGEEIPLVELRRMHKHWRQATTHRKPHVVVTLLGHFKNEVSECYHMMPVLSITPRGLEPEKWVKRALDEYSQRHIVSGYMFRNPDGTNMKAKAMEPKLHDRLEVIKAKRPDLISPEAEVQEEYCVSRSFRQGSTLVATNNGAPNHVIT